MMDINSNSSLLQSMIDDGNNIKTERGVNNETFQTDIEINNDYNHPYSVFDNQIISS